MQSMDDVLDRHFGLIGARVRVAAAGRPGAVTIDIRHDGRGEYFELRLPRRASTAVLNRDKAQRHLLLLISVDGEMSRFLCGHDERHWFVAAIPEAASGVVNVRTAKHALQPTLVQAADARLRPKERLRRRNHAFRRQGEWFLVPATGFEPDPRLVLRRARISRGGGSKPHIMELVFRRGGTPRLAPAQ